MDARHLAVVFDQVKADGVHNWLAWVQHKDEALGCIGHDPDGGRDR